MKSAKKFVAAIVAGLAVSATAVTAHAAVYENSYYFHLSDKGGYTFSAAAKKNNNLDCARVHVEEGYASETEYAYLTVCENKSYPSGAVTGSQLVEKPSGTYKLYYNDPEDKNCSQYYLCFRVGYYGAKLVGSWEP